MPSPPPFDGTAARLAQSPQGRRTSTRTSGCRCARSPSIRRPASRPSPSTILRPLHRPDCRRSTSKQGLARLRARPGSRRAATSRPMTAAMSSRKTTALPRGERLTPEFPIRNRPLEGQGRQGGHPACLCARRHHHAGDGVRRHPREPRPQGARRKRSSATARVSARTFPITSRRNSCATRWRAAGRSFPPTSIIPNPSR